MSASTNTELTARNLTLESAADAFMQQWSKTHGERPPLTLVLMSDTVALRAQAVEQAIRRGAPIVSFCAKSYRGQLPELRPAKDLCLALVDVTKWSPEALVREIAHLQSAHASGQWEGLLILGAKAPADLALLRPLLPEVVPAIHLQSLENMRFLELPPGAEA